MEVAHWLVLRMTHQCGSEPEEKNGSAQVQLLGFASYSL